MRRMISELRRDLAKAPSSAHRVLRCPPSPTRGKAKINPLHPDLFRLAFEIIIGFATVDQATEHAADVF